MKQRLFYTDHYPIPLPEGHRFPLRKYRLLREALERDSLFRFSPAPLASREEVELAHDAEYVRRFLDGSIDRMVMRRIGFPWSEGLVQRTLASVGSTIAAAQDAVSGGLGGSLAGGTHHAFHAEGAGFCIFNDIAVAIAVLRCKGFIRRAAVLDLDVHQGDGTAKLFEDDPAVFTASVHGRDNFPFRKQKSRLDVALDDGTTDAGYLEALRTVIPAVLASDPEVIFYQSGVDGLQADRLGRLGLTGEGLRQRDRIVFEACLKHGVPCVITLGGGYAEPIELTVEAHANTFRMASAVCCAPEPAPPTSAVLPAGALR